MRRASSGGSKAAGVWTPSSVSKRETLAEYHRVETGE